MPRRKTRVGAAKSLEPLQRELWGELLPPLAELENDPIRSELRGSNSANVLEGPQGGPSDDPGTGGQAGQTELWETVNGGDSYGTAESERNDEPARPIVSRPSFSESSW
jgi:hypothetical protein